MTEVRLEKLTKRFGAAEILKAVDLTVHSGEFFTVVGPSGCGKSTLLNLVAGLEAPTAGAIYFDDRPVHLLGPRERDVAMVFQSYALYPHMTVYDNLAFPLRMKKRSAAEIDRKVRDVAELLGLTPSLPRRPRELSGGQRQRVALGRAMVRQPRLFLLDEPLSNLDAQLRIEMRSELKKLHQALRATMIYVTHDQAEAMTLSDRIAVLHRGDLQQCGKPKEVYERPANLFVAGFIGHPPMNLLRGTFRLGPEAAVDLGAGTRFGLAGVLRDRLRDFPEGGELVLGLRPEHLRLRKSGKDLGRSVRLTLIEPMGSEVWLELGWGDHRLRAKAPAEFDGSVGQTFEFEIDESRVYFFNADRGDRIS
ncbi:MAG: ABC transporter ATP-binding protein [Nitrospirae bacterium]|nr:ABC transporter ATP-binding protein [Nitrospirota bacterium]